MSHPVRLGLNVLAAALTLALAPGAKAQFYPGYYAPYGYYPTPYYYYPVPPYVPPAYYPRSPVFVPRVFVPPVFVPPVFVPPFYRPRVGDAPRRSATPRIAYAAPRVVYAAPVRHAPIHVPVRRAPVRHAGLPRARFPADPAPEPNSVPASDPPRSPGN